MRVLFLLTACAALALAGASEVAASGGLRTRASPMDRHSDVVLASDDEVKYWCDDVLGCLNITSDWYSPMRPINRLPDTREHINTRFLINTRENKATDEAVLLVAGDHSSVLNSPFNASRPTKLTVHGLHDSANGGWLKRMTQELLDYDDYNVLRVDWEGGAAGMYSQAVANARVVGLEVGYLINWLADEYGLDRGTLHLIGHSLGAHVCGYGGEQINGLGRISGMDPAGPYFTNTLPMVRLDRTDAVFVDAMHTDGQPIITIGLGTQQPMGHIDFYPNGGRDQPGCKPFDLSSDCSHMRAADLYIETIRSSCNFLSHKCENYEEFEQGNCVSCAPDNTGCAFMGFHADEYIEKNTTEDVRFYGYTDGEEPYCYYQYVVTLLTDHPEQANDWVTGQLLGTFYGDSGETIEKQQLSEENVKVLLGEVNKFIVTSHVDVGKVIGIDLEWIYGEEESEVDSGSDRSLYVNTVQISSLNAYPESNRLELTQEFCSVDGETTEIRDGESVCFTNTDSCVNIPTV